MSDGHTSTYAALASGRSQRAGGLEFKITIVSQTFEGLPPLERQRIVYDALRPELESGAIHSLPLMRVWTPTQLAECKECGDRALKALVVAILACILLLVDAKDKGEGEVNGNINVRKC